MEHLEFKRFTKIPDYNDPNEMTTGRLAFDDEKCKRCGICSFICPARSIESDTGPGAWRNGMPRLMSSAPLSRLAAPSVGVLPYPPTLSHLPSPSGLRFCLAPGKMLHGDVMPAGATTHQEK